MAPDFAHSTDNIRRPDNHLRFSKEKLKTLPTPENGRKYYYDFAIPALALCVTNTGAKSFYVYKWADGRPTRVRIGKFPEISVEHARKVATKLINDLAEGRDPQAEKRASRQEATLGRLFDHWIAHAKQHKKSWKEDERQYKAFLRRWSARRLSDIEKGDVAALHSCVGKKNGPYAANRMLALLRAMFNKADEIGWNGTNPAAKIRMFKEQSRDRFLAADELPKFFAALAGETPLFRDFFILALLTGARRANVQAMRWEDLNLDLAIWRIPETKAGTAVLVPLVPRAVEILRQRRMDNTSGSEWVFPTHSRTGHLVEPKEAWKRILASANLRSIRLHDLRRTLGSWQAAAGASLTVIGRSLGHEAGSPVTAIYARLNLDPVRASVEQATAALLLAAEPKAKKQTPKTPTDLVKEEVSDER